jgi:hypothetical protein
LPDFRIVEGHSAGRHIAGLPIVDPKFRQPILPYPNLIQPQRM